MDGGTRPFTRDGCWDGETRIRGELYPPFFAKKCKKQCRERRDSGNQEKCRPKKIIRNLGLGVLVLVSFRMVASGRSR